jgi:hypothetical protein
MNKKLIFSITVFHIFFFCVAQDVAILKYDGGGDWYANPTSVPNLIRFANENAHTVISEKPKTVKPDSADLFDYPIVFMTGHGNVLFDDNAVENLRDYLISGGFLHVSDNYGIDQYIRREMKKVFPDLKFQEVPYNHPIYHQVFDFNELPKIHEHDGKPAQGFGIFYKGRLVVFYDYECDLSDGWEDPEMHHDPPEIREKALKMGTNIITYAFTN